MMEGKSLKPVSMKFATSTTAPSSPGRQSCANPWEDFYFSEPTSPTHFLKADHLHAAISGDDLRRRAVPFDGDEPRFTTSPCGDHSFEFEFSSRHSEADIDPVSAEDLFVNGQIRPLNQPKSFRLEGRSAWPPRPSRLTKVNPDQGLSTHERSSSSEPRVRTSLRNFLMEDMGSNNKNNAKAKDKFFQIHEGIKEGKSKDSRSYLRGLSKRWSIKDFLHRSSSDGKDGQWSSGLVPPAKQAHKHKHVLKYNKINEQVAGNSSSKPQDSKFASKRYDEREIVAKSPQSADGPTRNGRRASFSGQEAHFMKADDDDARRRSFLPYRRSLLGCLGLPSNSYANVTRLSRSLHPFS